MEWLLFVSAQRTEIILANNRIILLIGSVKMFLLKVLMFYAYSSVWCNILSKMPSYKWILLECRELLHNIFENAWMLARLIMVIILQYMQILNDCVMHQKLI